MWQIAVSAVALPLAVMAQSSTSAPTSTLSCTALRPSGSIRPSVASGYHLQVVATGLSRPRGLALDSQGQLLVVEAGSGVISGHTLNDDNGCVTVQNSRNVTGSMSLNHGIQLSEDGSTLYASSVENVFSWSYDAGERSVSNQATLVENMTGSDHSTRTLQLARAAPGMLVVSRGSAENLDLQAADIESGFSQVRAFNLTDRGDRIYNYATDGVLLGWGLRNSVGVGEHPATGGIWTVENSADNIVRDGEQVNQNNPAEEMNFLGYLNGTEYPQQGGNFGYPWCFTAWAPNELPNSQNLTVGRQFALSESSDLDNQNRTDAYCAEQNAARLAFQAHMAPLDIKFADGGDTAWVSMHGSWNRQVPVGYKVSTIEFSNGEPVSASDSTTSLTDIVANVDNTACPGNCLRPAGIVIDNQGRVYFASDASGEIYLITRDAAASGTSGQSNSPSGTSGSSPSQTPSMATSSFKLEPWHYAVAGAISLFSMFF